MTDHNTEKITIGVDGIDGYDVTVEIGVGAIKREIKRLEEKEPEQIGKWAFKRHDLSKFAQVYSEPTDEKWGELAESLGNDLK